MADAPPEIRAFVPEDWRGVCEVHAWGARHELTVSGVDLRAFRPMPDEEDLETFLHLNTALVTCLDSKVVAFVAWRDGGEWKDSGYLSWLYVHPAFHRRGIGDRLLTRALAALGDQAWTLAKQNNEPAIRLYQKHGMRVVKSWSTETRGYPLVEIRMALPTSRKGDPDAPNFGV